MITDVKTVSINSSVLDVVKKMNNFRIGSIVVVEKRKPMSVL